MPKYDGSIRINTEIDAKNVNSQMMKVMNSIEKNEAEVDRLRAKMKSLGETKTPTEEYKRLSKEIETAYADLDRLAAKQKELKDMGFSAIPESLLSELDKAGEKVGNLEIQMDELVKSGSAFTLGSDTDEYAKMSERVRYLTGNIEASKQKLVELNQKQKPITEEFSRVQKAAAGLGKIFGNAGKMAGKAFNSMRNAAKKLFSSITSGTKQSNGLLSTFASRLKGMALSLLIFNWISKGFNAMVSGMKTGFTNLMNYSSEYANSIQSLKNAMSTLGNSFAAAFAPIIQAAIPYLVQLINWVNDAVNAVAQLIAALSGKSTWTKATKVQAGYNDELKDTASSAKKAYGALAKFDDLDVLQKQDNTGTSGSASGADGGFEEVPVADGILDFAEKLKKIFSELFKPLKAAWDQEGQFVMDSWKYALNEIGNLAKDIGRDFLTVWNQDKTIQMLSDILHIIGDIGLVIGNVAHALDEAWNKNNTGLHILENIRDIFAAIVSNIRQAADYTVEWSAKLDFSPLLTAFESFTESLIPIVDVISGILADFYTDVLLPLSKWTLEKGLPEFLDILTEFNEKVDWEKIRENLKEFWGHLEPFAEKVGEGLLIFMRDLSDLVAGFLNSEKVTEFLEFLEGWMDRVTPEDVADGIRNLAISFLAFKAAVVIFDAALAASKIVENITKINNAFKALQTTGETLFAGAGIIGNLGITMDLFSKLNHLLGDTDGTKEYNKEIKSLNKALEDGTISQDEYAAAVAEAQEKAYDKIAELHGQTREEFEKTTDSVNKMTEEIPQKVTESATNAGIAAVAVGQALNDGLIEGLSKSNEEEMLSPFELFIAAVKALFGVHSPSTVFQEIGGYLIEGLSLGIQEKWESILEFFATAGENLKLFFFDTWTSIMENASEIWESVKQFFVDTWTLIQEKALEIWEHLRTTFDQKMDAIKDKTQKISDKFNEFKTTVSTVFTSVKESIVGAIEKIIGKISDFISKIQEAIQAVKDFLSSGFEKISGFFGGIFGGSGSSGISATAYSVNATSYSLDDVPALASGAVIRGGNPFLAMLGDQPSGQTNIEAPLSTIEQAVKNVLGRSGYGLSGSVRITLQLNGQDVGEALIDDLISVMNRRGMNVDILGVT